MYIELGVLPLEATQIYDRVYESTLDIDNDDNWQEAHEKARDALLSSSYGAQYQTYLTRQREARDTEAARWRAGSRAISAAIKAGVID